MDCRFVTTLFDYFGVLTVLWMHKCYQFWVERVQEGGRGDIVFKNIERLSIFFILKNTPNYF
jgi:hypothetical protein